MSSYEFWDELGKIFSAVVAYQEKNIEFNRRFINPWIRLGNVFDKQDRDHEAVIAYEKAIEIDPANAQYWFELGNIHFKMKRYEKAVEAFNKALELDPAAGWSYNNLALALVSQGNYEQAIPLYQKAIELLGEAKDRAVAWNRLGNAYRKLDEYDLALEAFRNADELDRDNAGFRDTLDEVSQAPTLVQSRTEGGTEQTGTLSISPIELIVAESGAEELASRGLDATAAYESASDAPASPSQFEGQEVAAAADLNAEESGARLDALGALRTAQSMESDPAFAVLAAEAGSYADAGLATAESGGTGIGQPEDSDPAFAVLASTEEGAHEAGGQEATELGVQAMDQSLDSDPAFAILIGTEEGAHEASGQEVTELGVQGIDQSPDSDPAFGVLVAAEEGAHGAGDPAATEMPSAEAQEPAIAETEATQSTSPIAANTDREPVETAEHGAYEEFLKDSDEPLSMYEPAAAVDATGSAEVTPAAQEPVAKIDQSGEIQIEMDTKNAHAWNELGNVYFNTGAFDDAIVAYSKAIELDRWFAWPYSNLALAYVQKRRFVEAILLYQRSIELFSTEKDKAISWNRLGNVYRRLNDYENAIQAYQLADELDPDNTTLSLQSRFSLLGSYALDQKVSYVS